MAWLAIFVFGGGARVVFGGLACLLVVVWKVGICVEKLEGGEESGSGSVRKWLRERKRCER